MTNYEEKETKHKKRSSKKTPKKSDHKHIFVNQGRSEKYSFADKLVCEICGKTKTEFNINNLISRD